MSTDRPPPPHDVRMRGFARRTTVEAALAWIDQLARQLSAEQVPIWQAASRILAADIVSPVDVPGFPRSMMDGYALHAADTLGATPYNTLKLQIVGQSLPGNPFQKTLERGQAIQITTGAPLPSSADAVLPAEHVEVENNRLVVQGEVSPGKNVGQRGEDIVAGATVLSAGRTLRPQDLGLLSSIGCREVNVIRQPRVQIIITGNELLPAGSSPQTNKITDANGPMLHALITRDGGLPFLSPSPSLPLSHSAPYLVPDDPAAILTAFQSPADVILVSGGSSVGQEDFAPSLLALHGELPIHGIAMRPSSPTGMGRLGEKIVFLLPGNPVSCLCAYDFFAGRTIRLLAGRSPDWPYRKVQLPLARKLVSQVGRVDYARVRLIDNDDGEKRVEPLAISGASILSSTTLADGFVIIPADLEGYPPDALITVYLYEPLPQLTTDN